MADPGIDWCKGCGYAPTHCHCNKPKPASLTPEMLSEEDREMIRTLRYAVNCMADYGHRLASCEIAAIAWADRLLQQGEG